MKTIYAQTADGRHTLLKNGNPKIIGRVEELGKRHKKDGTLEIVKMVIFDFEQNGAYDRFFFENDILVYSCVSLTTDAYITDIYRELSIEENVTFKLFLEKVLEAYVFEAMGFN